MILRYILISLTFLSFFSCDTNQRKMNLIDGEWQGTLLLEQGDSVPIDPAELGFTFDQEDRTYTYHSTLNHREAGDFYIQTKYLFTVDTLKANPLEKSVEILKLNADSLHLKMMEKGRERLLKLVKTEE